MSLLLALAEFRRYPKEICLTRHIVLLGDSIFDNALYVPRGESVIEHLRRSLPNGDQATVIALDGATVTSVFRQLERVPEDATHFVLSAGGNNALQMAINIFSQPSADIRSSLKRIAEYLSEFTAEYRKLVQDLLAMGRHLSICTVYDSVPGLDTSEIAGLCVFNDTITRTAFQYGATLIDLRTICNESTDYSSISPIEPSASGGGKIVRAIMEAISDGREFHRVIG